MFDVGMEQLSDDDLLSELRKRFHSMVFAGLSRNQVDTHYVMGGNKLVCVGLAGALQSQCIDAEVE